MPPESNFEKPPEKSDDEPASDLDAALDSYGALLKQHEEHPEDLKVQDALEAQRTNLLDVAATSQSIDRELQTAQLREEEGITRSEENAKQFGGQPGTTYTETLKEFEQVAEVLKENDHGFLVPQLLEYEMLYYRTFISIHEYLENHPDTHPVLAEKVIAQLTESWNAIKALEEQLGLTKDATKDAQLLATMRLQRLRAVRNGFEYHLNILLLLKEALEGTSTKDNPK